MVNINLSTNQPTQIANQGISMINGGMIAVIITLLLVIAAGSGLMVWRNELKKQAVVMESSYQDKTNVLLASERNKDIVDFQNRISLVNELIDQPGAAVNVLQDIENRLVSGVYLTSLNIDKTIKTLKLECAADNYEAVARQILSFKGSEYFSEVSMDKSTLSTEKGKNIFSISIKLIN